MVMLRVFSAAALSVPQGGKSIHMLFLSKSMDTFVKKSTLVEVKVLIQVLYSSKSKKV